MTTALPKHKGSHGSGSGSGSGSVAGQFGRSGRLQARHVSRQPLAACACTVIHPPLSSRLTPALEIHESAISYTPSPLHVHTHTHSHAPSHAHPPTWNCKQSLPVPICLAAAQPPNPTTTTLASAQGLRGLCRRLVGASQLQSATAASLFHSPRAFQITPAQSARSLPGSYIMFAPSSRVYRTLLTSARLQTASINPASTATLYRPLFTQRFFSNTASMSEQKQGVHNLQK